MARPEAPRADPRYPLRLNTGRYRDQWHTMTRTGLSPRLSQHRREALLEIHPLDAASYGLNDGGLARVLTLSGEAVFRVSVQDTQRRGDIFVPMHWTDVTSGGARANRLVEQSVDPLSGQPGFKNTPARVETVLPAWRAFLVSTREVCLPDLTWWSRSRIRGGWLYELAGDAVLDVARLLPEGRTGEAGDLVRGMRRMAVWDNDARLLAALFMTRAGELPPRDWVAEQLGNDGAGFVEILAGRPAVPAVDRGPMVCVCHGVGELDITAAACAGAHTVAAVGELTQAGTNCGSCRPAIARLIETWRVQDMECVA